MSKHASGGACGKGGHLPQSPYLAISKRTAHLSPEVCTHYRLKARSALQSQQGWLQLGRACLMQSMLQR